MATPQAEAEPGAFALGSFNTALCLVPPEDSWAAVDSLRVLYDKAYDKWPPHVNMVYPFVQPEQLEGAVRRMQMALQQSAGEPVATTIDVQLDSTDVFQQRRENTIFLHDGREVNGLEKLRARLLAALSTSSQSQSQSQDKDDSHQLHMTVAQTSGSGDDGEDGDEPSETLGHAHRFLRHKVELLPAVAWRADRLHILVRERTEQGGIVSSRMRLWGVVHLEDGRLERLSREPFYEQVGADARNEDQNEDQGEEDDDLDNTPLPSCHPVTFVPEDRYWMACPREDWGLFEPAAGRATGGLNTLTVATYNVLGASAWPSSRARVPLLVDSILEAGAMADVLVLVEVTDDVLSELLADDGVRTAFPFASHGPPDQEDMPPLPRLFNSVVLSRRPFVWSWVAFAQAHKGALVARWGEMGEDKKPKLVVAAVHLTHGLIGDAVTCKRAEALRLLRHLRRYHSSADVFIAGNVNVQAVGHGFDDLFSREGFVDLWRRQSDKAELDGEQGATYDLLHNNRPQWLVRIFVRQASEEAQNADSRRLRIVDAKLFGLSAAGSDTTASESFASDYWGLRCVVERVEGEGCDDGEDKGSKKETETETEIELTNKQLAISNEVKLVPVQAPVGLLADATALDRALVVLEAMPSDEEVEQRREALALLQRILVAEKSNGGAESASSPPRLPRQLVVVPVGSYGLGVWTLTSEMDCLCIGVYAATTFFAIATQRLRAAGQGSQAEDVQIVRRVRAHAGTMLELSVNGLHVNLQYCQAAVVAETWPAVLVVAADHALITTLSPQTLSRLKVVRDLHALRASFSKGEGRYTAEHFQTAYRSIKTWARSRGLYAARFGYLGGIQIAVLLARVMKLMAAATDDDDDDDDRSAVPDTLATFFRHYAGFDWATQMAFDPFFHGHKAPHVRPAGEPLVILGYHRPQLNTSMSASMSSVRVLAAELRRADRLLSAGRTSWDAFLSGGGDEGDSSTIVAGRLPSGAAAFVCAYRTYVKIDLQYWGLSLQRGASFVGWLESRCAMLLVDVARRLPQLNTHIWPGRFVEGDEGDGEGDDAEIDTETTQYQGCYLIGLDLAASLSRDDRRIALDTLQSVLSTFERQMRRSGGEYDAQWMWLGVSIASQTDLGDVGRLRLDERAWYTSEEEEEESEEEEARPKKKDKKDKKNKDKDRFKAAPQVGTGKKFRSAQDVIKRLRWDPQLDRADYVVGYEDRFVGAQERPLSAWKSEQTDEEFIPQHRVLYFRRRSDGAVIWDRRARKDEVFGSGM